MLQEEAKTKKILNEKETALRIQSLELDMNIKKMQLNRETQETIYREQLLKLEIQLKEQQFKN